VTADVSVAATVLERTELGAVEELHVRGVADNLTSMDRSSGLLRQIPVVEVHQGTLRSNACSRMLHLCHSEGGFSSSPFRGVAPIQLTTTVLL
jgi:hypothetical protein